MTEQANPFQVTQGLEVLPPRSGKAYPIPCDEWDILKGKIKGLSNEPWLFHNLGSILAGASASTFVALLLGNPPPSQQQAVVIAWAVVITTAIVGALCWYFAHKERGVQHERASDVIAQMELIEKRYK